MATECGLTPPGPDRRIAMEGTRVFVTHTIPSCAMESWVKSIAEASGQPVDWYYSGGTIIVRALGNLDLVKAEIVQQMPEHDNLFIQECRKYLPTGPIYPPRLGWWST